MWFLVMVFVHTAECLPGFVDCESSLEFGRAVMGSPITPSSDVDLTFLDKSTGKVIQTFKPGEDVLVSASFGEEEKTLFVLRTTVGSIGCSVNPFIANQCATQTYATDLAGSFEVTWTPPKEKSPENVTFILVYSQGYGEHVMRLDSVLKRDDSVLKGDAEEPSLRAGGKLVDDQSTCSSPTDSEEDCEALRDIYNIWKDQSKRVASWQFGNTSISICDFEGIFCNDEKKRVTQFVLSDEQLHGSIPSIISNLTALTNIDLTNNRLTGNTPFIKTLHNLSNLDLGRNDMSGGIPCLQGENVSLPLLRNIVAYDNNLDGTLPNTFRMGENIQMLILFKNRMHGTIPSAIGELRNLIALDVRSSRSTHSIQPSITLELYNRYVEIFSVV